MTALDGLSSANLVDTILASFRGATFTIGATYAELHTAPPGADGSLALSAGCATRWPVCFAAPSGAAIAEQGNPPAFLNGGVIGEKITDIAIWSAQQAGTYYWSAPLTTPISWGSNDTINLNTCGLSLGPVAGVSTVGLSTYLINLILASFVGYGTPATLFTIPATYVQLHTAIPGAAGTTAVSAGSTTRDAALFQPPANNLLTLSTSPTWTNGGTSETLTHVSVWDASTSGHFLWSAALTTPVAWASAQLFTLNSLPLGLGPVATSS